MTISLIFKLSDKSLSIAAFGFIATKYDDRIPPSMKFFLRDFSFLSQSLVLKSSAHEEVFYGEISVFRIASVQIKPFMAIFMQNSLYLRPRITLFKLFFSLFRNWTTASPTLPYPPPIFRIYTGNINHDRSPPFIPPPPLLHYEGGELI